MKILDPADQRGISKQDEAVAAAWDTVHDALVDAAYDHFGALDLLVNSAAGMEKTKLGHVRAPEFDAIIALNLRAPFFLAQAAARLMPAGSAIVNIADHMALEPWPDYSVHGIAKAGVIALTRHLAAALAPDIRVNAVAPGFVLAPPGFPSDAVDAFAVHAHYRCSSLCWEQMTVAVFHFLGLVAHQFADDAAINAGGGEIRCERVPEGVKAA